MIHADTSLVVAYYCPEPSSGAAEVALRADGQPAVSELTEGEFFSALARKLRLRDLSRRDVDRVTAQFVAHLADGLYARLPVERRHYDVARTWIAGFTVPLRTLDALHLAVAASAHLRFATLDRRSLASQIVSGSPLSSCADLETRRP